MLRAFIFASSVLLAAAGCADDAPAEDPCASPVPEGGHYQFVVSQIDMPTNTDSTRALALDLDGDGIGDNRMGQILSAVESSFPSYDLDAEADGLIANGTLIPLFDLQTVDLVSATHVGLTVLHGLDLDGDPSNNTSGSELFGIDTSRGSGLLVGCIDGGTVDVAHGAVPVAFTFPGLGDAFVVRLEGARVVGQVGASGFSGLIGGGMSQQTIDGDFEPALQRGFDNIVVRDCPNGAGSCTSDFASALLDLFDTSPEDGRISLSELQNSSLIRSLLALDVDLDQDGTVDHLSVGLGFTAVPAVIQQ